MARGTVKVGPAGRFGPRYGVKTRTQIAAIERKQKALHPCPRCGQVRVKRLGTGIWRCRRCELVFAGGAYSPKAAKVASVPDEPIQGEMKVVAPVKAGRIGPAGTVKPARKMKKVAAVRAKEPKVVKAVKEAK